MQLFGVHPVYIFYTLSEASGVRCNTNPTWRQIRKIVKENNLSVTNDIHKHGVSGQIRFFTVHFHFTKGNIGRSSKSIRIRRMSSVVVVDDVSPVMRTSDVNRVRYCGWRVVGVPKTQHSVLFVCCVGYVDVKAEEPGGVSITNI